MPHLRWLPCAQVSYVVVLVPYVAVLVLLIRAVSMSGSSKGVHFYTTPKWELLRQPRMWGDAAAQVFFSLSVCWGGLTTLASYNKFNNNVYRYTPLPLTIMCTGTLLQLTTVVPIISCCTYSVAFASRECLILKVDAQV